MIYTKPYNVTYTDMCIYIDTHIYTDDYDEVIVYQYLYFIIRMLALKENYFKRYSNYDDFAIYGATRVYCRLTNSKQFELQDNGEPKLKKIVSVLNYIKKMLYPLKVDFEQSTYYNCDIKGVTPADDKYSFNNILMKNINHLGISEFNLMLSDIGKTCKEFLSSIPYKKSSVEWLNIYTSVMLTFLNSITLNRYSKEKVNHLQDTGNLNQKKINQIFEEESTDSTILFHLPDNMKNYITVLTRQLKHIVAKDLSDILHTKVTEDFMLQECLTNDYVEETIYNDDTSTT